MVAEPPPGAMMLPCSTNQKSVTSFSTMLLTLIAMALVAADVVNDEKKHHVELAATSLGGDALQPKMNGMGFRGTNSMWNISSQQRDGERRSAVLEFDDAQCAPAGNQLKVRGPNF